MRFLFYRDNSLLSKFLCWYFKEPFCYFAIEVDSVIYTSGLGGISKYYWDEFLKNKIQIIHCMKLKINDEKVNEFVQEMSALPAVTNKIRSLYRIIFKKEKKDYLCTEIFKKLPSWLIVEGVRQRNFGLITAFRLYNLILEHIRTDTVKIESIR